MSPNSQFLELPSLHPDAVERSLEFYENPLFNSQISSPRHQMVVVGGGGAEGGAGGVGGAGGASGVRGAGGQGPPPPPPIIFAKVAARYAPLVLSLVLHDLPENYMKNLSKFMGEGDLTATEHINFFDQFTNILGIEHEDVYSRLQVQNFEGQVRIWF
jgi:hypothetical protein